MAEEEEVEDGATRTGTNVDFDYNLNLLLKNEYFLKIFFTEN